MNVALISLITIAVILILYGVVSKPLDARGITSAMIFLTAGLCVGTSALKLVNIHIESHTAERFCELALVFLLFSDSTRIDLANLRRHLSWPCRLLFIGLPLTIAAGLGVGLLVFPTMALASAFVLSTMICSTDAALGQRVVSDPSVPARVRQALNVESGLNDGLAVPFFLVAVDLSLAKLSGHFTAAVVRNMVEQIGWGLVAGIGPAYWWACCSAWRMIAGGWRDNGGRFCPLWGRCLPTWSRCGWAAAASSQPSPEG